MTRRIGLCHACAEHGRPVPAKYRCPACQVASCSLPCVITHKTTTKCTGVRNRAAAVRKVHYTQAHLLSDYTLLEDAGRAIDSAVRVRQVSAMRPNSRASVLPPGISKGRMAMLSKEAAKRAINLRFMPRGFARHARNSSHVRSIPAQDLPPPPPGNVEERAKDLSREQREKAMFWHLDLYFASCSHRCPGTKLVKVDACEEEQRIDAILSGATAALKNGRKRKRSDAITCTSKANDGYSKYLAAAPDELVVFLRNEHVLSAASLNSPATSPRPVPARPDNKFDLNRYIPIDNQQTLRQALSGRSVVEFPVLHVAFKGSKQAEELACATSGIFEKPDDSDDSDSASSAASQSGEEGENEDEEEGQIPEVAEPKKLLPTLETVPVKKMAEISQSSPGPGNLSVEDQEQASLEPPLKIRRPDSPPSVTPAASCSEARDSRPVISAIPSSNGKSDESPKRHSPIARDNHQNIIDRPKMSMKDEDQTKIHSRSNSGKWKGGERSSKNTLNLEDFGTSESESFAVDPHGRREAGLLLDDPFMRESVKAILETRIPRKRRDDKAAQYSSNSDKQSPSRKLAATG